MPALRPLTTLAKGRVSGSRPSAQPATFAAFSSGAPRWGVRGRRRAEAARSTRDGDRWAQVELSRSASAMSVRTPNPDAPLPT
jgi:hypothetical protein